MPFARPTLTELVERARDDFDARVPGADSRLRRSVLDVLARVHAGALNGLYGLIDFMWRQIFPDTAEAEQLARWSAIWGVTRKAATPATGTVALTGTNGAVVPIGSPLVRADGFDYLTTEAATIAGGVASVAIEAVVAGAASNAIIGQKLVFSSPIAGVNAQATVEAGGLIGGAAEEGDELLRGRLLARIQKPPHGGNKSDYEAWALEFPEVTRAWVYPSELGIGTVTVRFVMDGRVDIIPEAGDVAAVEDYIDERRPVTAQLYVFAPVAQPVDFVVRAVPPSAEVQAAIEEELKDLLRREAEPGGDILISHIREAISLAAGEFDHEVIAPLANLHFAPGQLPTFGSVTFVA